MGFDWDKIDGAYNKVYEEIDELNQAILEKNKDNIEEELGDLLFSIVNLSRHIDTNPEVALDKSILKFIKRFHILEDSIKKEKLDFKKQSLSQLDKLWNKAKKIEKSN